MLILSATTKNIQKARKILKRGGIIIYPTDTLYGLGADIFNFKAIKKIFFLKGRSYKKPISVIVSSVAEIKKVALMTKKQEMMARGLLPGPFTLILRKKKIISSLLTAGSNKIGIRVPRSQTCHRLVKNLPLTTTSANLAGQRPTNNIKKMAKIFGHQVDLILVGTNLSGQASHIIDLSQHPYKILR